MLKTAVESELKKESGRVWACLADMKGVFDNVKRCEIWKEMEKMEVDSKLRKRIRELYEDTKCEVVIRGERVGQFRTNNGVKQGCPLSPGLFNVSMAKLETEMKKVQEQGIVIGKKKIYEAFHVNCPSARRASPKSCYF